MSSIFVITLTAHIITGLIGTFASYVIVLSLLKKELPLTKLKVSAVIAYASYFTSWLTAGYYYWFYYGSQVKPVIKAGNYVWAHNVVMETKEHVFFLLPTLTFVLAMIIFFSGNRLATDAAFRTRVLFLASTTLVIAIAITLAGIIISGAAR